MGTNYYVKSRKCECCGHQPEYLHIGKSSAGWCFSLHVIPELSLNSWTDWVKYLEDKEIIDEYYEGVSLQELISVVSDRGRDKDWESDWWKFLDYYQSEEHFHRVNMSKRGPNGLLRARVDGRHCVGNGEGTWDYIAGEFS